MKQMNIPQKIAKRVTDAYSVEDVYHMVGTEIKLLSGDHGIDGREVAGMMDGQAYRYYKKTYPGKMTVELVVMDSLLQKAMSPTESLSGHLLDEARQILGRRYFGLGGEQDRLYYVTDGTYCGNMMNWWRRGGRGYSSKIEEAEIFTEKDAIDLIRNHPDKLFSAYPVDHIDSVVSRHVDSQNVDYSTKLAVSDKVN